ncbi:MAG: GTPase Era [Magnetococcales bacterium]|nr:GTPase Era [Magnetococcales bacterium]
MTSTRDQEEPDSVIQPPHEEPTSLAHEEESPLHSGFITLAGRPNMGKSTFLNRVIGRKVAVVTHKAQTTRTRILGVRHAPGSQMVFVDTPGLHGTGGNRLNRLMVRAAHDALADVTAVLYFVDVAKGLTGADRTILKDLVKANVPWVLMLNKIDRVEEALVLERLAGVEAWSQESGITFHAAIPLSARTGKNMEAVLSHLETLLPPGPAYYPPDQTTDQPETFFVAEIVREKLFLNLHQELPYALAVQVVEFREEKKSLHCTVDILVEKRSQKGIVIGRKGEVLKRVGSLARKELERRFGIKVMLKLWVRVEPRWRTDDALLQELGYSDGTPGGD